MFEVLTKALAFVSEHRLVGEEALKFFCMNNEHLDCSPVLKSACAFFHLSASN